GIVEFSEAAHEHTAGVLRSLRDWLLAKFGQAEADAAIPGWQIESIKEMARYHDAPIEQAAFAEAAAIPSTPSEDQPHDHPKETDMSQETAAALAAATARADAAEAEVKRLQAEQTQSLLAAGHKANADFAESLAADGKLKPADKALVVQLLNFAEYPQHTAAEFGEGDAVQSLAEGLRGFLRALPPAMEFAETATATRAAAGTPAAVADFAEADADTVAHHQRAQALMAKEGISYEEAARRTAI
ncbi:2-oxoacid:acceptor oxidoreductase, partial [Paralysiella testudinis]